MIQKPGLWLVWSRVVAPPVEELAFTKVDGIKVNILLALYLVIFQSSSYLASVW